MTINVSCDKCGNEIEGQAALAWSPPVVPPERLHEKYHMCRDCWVRFLRWINQE